MTGQRSKSDTKFGWTGSDGGIRHRTLLLLLVVWSMTGLTLVLGACPASASQQAINYFGTASGTGTLGGEFSQVGDIAVNSTGAGPAGEGDIYVADGSRIQRFGQDDNGTPSNPYDDTYPFLGAYGAGVDSGQPGNGYEVCAVATNCTAGLPTGGNGAISDANGIAVDQDTGFVYVSDGPNRRINVYEGDGTFLRSFGWDVVQSGPDEAGTGYEICVAANGDVCKAGVLGAGIGQLNAPQGIAVSPPDGNTATGTVFVADRENRRIDTYALDGSGPGSFGSAANFAGPSPEFVAVDSRGIVYATDRNNTSEVDRYDSSNANGGGVGFLAPIASPPLSIENNQRKGLEVDPDSDGAGPDTDVLYSIRDGASGTTVVQQFGPLNAPGLSAPPSAVDDEHGLVAGFSFVNGLGLDISSGRLFISTPYNIGGAPSPSGEGAKSGVYVLGPAGGVPTASLDSISDVTASSATIHATVSPNGGPPVSYRLEYSLDGTNWKSTPETLVGVQETPVPITAVLDPPPFGLDPVALYHVRVKVTKAFTPSLTTSELTFTTSTVPPAVETTGSPIRTTESAKLGGRVTPRGSATTYFFEYGDQGPCGSNPCTQTPAQPAGTGQFVQLVAEEVTELQPGTTYHYRVVADNGQPGSPVFGEDMTVTTRSGEAPLSHGHFPGPPGSDRAWEQVSAPNAGGNSVTGTNVISDNGTRAVWELNGGSPSSETGGFNQFYSERTSHGWLSKSIYPPRNQLAGPNWHPPMGPSDLSLFTALNFEIGGRFALFRMTPGLPPKKLHEVGSEAEWGSFELMSDDGSRVLMATTTSADPAHPVSPGAAHLYDVTSGDPHLVDLLPGETIPTCGLQIGGHGSSSPYFMSSPSRGDHWISADGNLAYFMGRSGATCGRTQIYVRDFSAAETKQLSGAAVSGEACSAGFIQSNPKSVLFWTKARLVVEDSEPADCTTSDAHGDVYRYDLSSESLDCVTCAVEGVDANVFVGGAEPGANIAVAPDGSRVYFRTSQILLPGARTPGIYRADVESGDLAYVGSIGEVLLGLNEMSADGSLLFFSSSDSSLNALGGGSGNAGTAQLYRYDDDDRSLICVSCPQDGSAPRGAASRAGGGGGSPNVTQLSENGIFAFSTPTPLTGADQNTAAPGQDPQRGTDAYEWRDGRLLLLSDGLTDWPGGEGAPAIKGMTPSGSDILFTAAAQYTPDALDNFRRLYTARIAGGIEFPKPPPPCPLEVCQGTPKGAPEEAAPGTGVFAGPGNLSQRKPGRCAAGKRKVRRGGKTRCVSKKRPARKANHNRRVAR